MSPKHLRLKIGRPGRPDRRPTGPEISEVWYLYEQQLVPAYHEGRYEKAVNVAYRILRLAPDDEQTWGVLIHTLRKCEVEPAIMLKVAQQAVACVPELKMAHELLLSSAARLGDWAVLATAVKRFQRLFWGQLNRTDLKRLQDLSIAAEYNLHIQSAQHRKKEGGRPSDQARNSLFRAVVREQEQIRPPPDQEAARTPRILVVPYDSPEGTALSIEAASPAGLLKRLAEPSQDGMGLIDLLLRAAELETAERFDRLLSLEIMQGVKHFPHQFETVLHVLKRFHGRVLLADEVGLGKTIEACLVLSEYRLRGLVKRALVLCPTALVVQWRAELAEKFGIEARTNLEPAFQEDPAAFLEQPGVVVMSLAIARTERYRHALLARHFDLVVADEAHHLKNRATRGWELVNALRSRFLLLLTATPVETNLTELYNIVTLLRPGTLGTESDFRKRFQDRRDPLKPRDHEQLRELLRDVMIRNNRAQAGVDLPPRVARTIIVPPSQEERLLYDAIVAFARVAGSADRTLARLLLEEAGSSSLAVARTASGASPRTPELGKVLQQLAMLAGAIRRQHKIDRLCELIPGGKVLVFTRFLATHEAIARELDQRGFDYCTFTGKMPAHQRSAQVQRFQEQTGVMLCSEVGGEGQNLQFCHRIINFDLPWNPMVIEQRIGRVHRIGQEQAVEIVNLCMAGTAEEHLLAILDQRINLFELVIGEMDLLIGALEDEREFGERVYEVYARSTEEEDIQEGFDRLAETLLRAHDHLRRVQQADSLIFGDELGVY
ncbi:MAG: DEAD/DEAH box helicase [Bradymonadales bacterium]|nr:DEAD/DEAH box helicase [Bradymonadales bacterium]